MNHAFDTKALELSRQAIALFFEPMPGVQLQAKIQNLFIAAMEFAAPEVQEGQPVSQPYTLPEGYALVPIEPTEEMLAAAKEWTGLTSTAEIVYSKMIAAAPNFRENADSSTNNFRENADSSTNGWIPCSERMPPSRHAVLVGCWWGREWVSKWATYIPGHPDAQESGWLIPGASWNPTHWMPLPAAPKTK